jgi:hypothetical protein
MPYEASPKFVPATVPLNMLNVACAATGLSAFLIPVLQRINTFDETLDGVIVAVIPVVT